MQRSKSNSGIHHGPRRTSCSECIKAKRRCDKRAPGPQCLRCSKLKLRCRYTEPQAQERTELDAVNTDWSMFNDSNELSLPFLENMDQTLLPPEGSDLPFLNDSSVQQMPVPEFVEWDLANQAESRIQYGIQVLKTAPATMVLNNSTPWSHPLLYKDHMPKSMHDAHASCALYLAKNDINKRMIFRAINTRVKDLANSLEPVTPLEKLAYIQSLLLYQIMRLCDEDIHFRAQGEADVEILRQYAYDFLAILDDQKMACAIRESTGPQYSSTSPPSVINPLSMPSISYSAWIFEESCCRTALASFFLLGFYGLLKGDSCSNHTMASSSFVASSHLWSAPSEFDFRVALKERCFFVVRDLDFDVILRDASPDDIDDFGKMILVGCRGLDDIRTWFYERGSALIC